MVKTKILLCGATGFIGRNIAEHYASCKDYELHLVRHKSPEYDVPGAIWHKVDLRDAYKVEQLVNGKDIIIQAAATTSGARDIINQPYIHVTDNAVMNSVLFRAAFEAKVKHLVFFSCTVMYQSSDHLIKENDLDPRAPLHPHYFGVANTKLYVEKMCEFFSNISNTKFTAIRHSNIYGAYDKFDLARSHVFGATISKVMVAKEKVSVWGSGEEERDLLHATDLCSFVDAVIKKQPVKFRIYNCGLGQKTSIKELVSKVVDASGKSLRIEHDLSQPTIKTSLCLDTNLAQQELGWKPNTSIDEGIKNTILWWSENIDPSTLTLKSER